ncbi:alkaline phosphatase family protein, partial [Mycobacterium tuberculosis]
RISATIRTARSRSSGGYLLDEPPDMTPSFPRTGVSGHAGAVQLIIAYDEHGGFFDHVTPLTAPEGTPCEWIPNSVDIDKVDGSG